LFRNAGLAQAFENVLEAGQIRRVVAPRRPGGAGAGDREGRVERETGLDCRMRLIESIKLSEGGRQMKNCYRIISVGLGRPPILRDRLLPTAEVELRQTRHIHPEVSQRIAGTEAKRLSNLSLCFL
jgi:hypothetical protein